MWGTHIAQYIGHTPPLLDTQESDNFNNKAKMDDEINNIQCDHCE